MLSFAILHAPSVLGLKPSGVDRLPYALQKAGLHNALGGSFEGSVAAPSFDPQQHPNTLMLNSPAIREYSRRLAGEVGRLVRSGRIPVVLGGDCSILLGNMLALRRLGRFGLFFIDGHADFYLPEVEPSGEVASMDLTFVTGRGPGVLADIDGLRPLVRDEDTVVFGYRDAVQAEREGSPDVRQTGMMVLNPEEVRQLGVRIAATNALGWLMEKPVQGFWIHLDADVLDDAVMPAVDYRMPGGLSPEELVDVLSILRSSGRVVGIDVTIYNPNLDPDGSAARILTDVLVKGLVE
jgi:arginase